ncbi:hypothetical protein [Deinococcus sp. Leaf326]|jgi:hypothetical protein|uniref:hypothetical protein n=1 Tax=Deinococcus sp. Leaf326 TaxID=1736338 RepID=UPI0006FBB1D4|nr:hypothetical protein [Deinococcus sp. Leaf326]KQQ97828.1 hypothetical protein ASF71_14495 [Deinococcus sp. Leaf326]
MKTPRVRTVNSGKKSSTLRQLLVYAPVALEMINLLRRRQQSVRGKYVKARKRDKAFDFVLNQAQRRLGGKTSGKSRRWF